jgi:hypothetical protein
MTRLIMKDTNYVRRSTCGFIAAEVLSVTIMILYVFVNMMLLRPVMWRSLPPLPIGSAVEILHAYTQNPSYHRLEYKLFVKSNIGEFYSWTGRDPYISDGYWEKSTMSETTAILSALPQPRDRCGNYPVPPRLWFREPLDIAKACSDFSRDHVSRIRHYALLANGRILMAASNDYLPLLLYPAIGLIVPFLIHFIIRVILDLSRK